MRTFVAGRFRSAFSHFSLLGLAAIVEDSGSRVRFGWCSDKGAPKAFLDCELSLNEIAEVVHAHASHHLTQSSWMQVTTDVGKNDGRPIFTPRGVKLDPGQCEDYVAQRRSWLTENPEQAAGLDGRMLAGLGEFAWWHNDCKLRSEDDGASRWEMKARNKGMDVIRDQALKLAKAVALRDVAAVRDGISGAQVVDEVGKNDLESRSATGFQMPGPVDNVLAWCALWGMSVFPVAHQTPEAHTSSHGLSQTPCTFGRRRVHPEHAGLPVFDGPVSLRKYRYVVLSRALDIELFHRETADTAAVARSARWLLGQGVGWVLDFTIHLGGSSSAPERALRLGVPRKLEAHTLGIA